METPLLKMRKLYSATLSLLTFIAIFSCFWSFISNKVLSKQASLARAHYIADSICESLKLAVEVGIPFHEIRGVEAILYSYVNENDNIHRITVLDLTNVAIWQVTGKKQTQDLLHITTPVLLHNRIIAHVNVDIYPTRLFLMMVSTFILQIILSILIGIACYEALTFALSRGMGLQIQAKKQMYQDILHGRLDKITIGQSKIVDAALHNIIQRVRKINEQIWHIRTLGNSLRNTEPEATGRTDITTILSQAEQQLLFANRKPKLIILSTLMNDIRWLYFLSAIATESVLPLMLPSTMKAQAPLLVFLGAVGALIGLWINHKFARYWRIQHWTTLGATIILSGLTLVGLYPGTLYSALARPIIYIGMMMVTGGFSAMSCIKEAQASWFIAAVTGGLLLGRVSSSFILNWLEKNVWVGFAVALILFMLILINKFSWSREAEIWRHPIAKLAPSNLIISPLVLCNGIIAGLLLIFALENFDLDIKGLDHGEDKYIVIIALLWLALGFGAWTGYMLSIKHRILLWSLALTSSILLLLGYLPSILSNLIFCFSVSALEWHTRCTDPQYIPKTMLSDFLGIMIGSGIYFMTNLYLSNLNIITVFIGITILLGTLLFARKNKSIG